MRTARVIFYIAIISIGLVAAATAWAVRFPEVQPVEPPQASTFSADLIARGAQLAGIGNCQACHTAQDGEAFAGGVPIPTPFGTIYSTNITPDPDTGIGRWSEEAFRRAMRQGIDREGRQLYPAFPYDHFTLARGEDIQAIYAFLMTREAVQAERRANDIPFPFNIRPIVAGWNLLYLKEEPRGTNAGQSPEWNRGAYLVEGLGHCGSCHTPRNALGAEDRDRYLGGGFGEGWTGPALNARSPSAVPWSAEDIAAYLRGEMVAHHGIALGPMVDVVEGASKLPDSDLAAIGAYLASLQKSDRPTDPVVARAQEVEPKVTEVAASSTAASTGAEIFMGACATCHRSGGRLPYLRPNELGLSTMVRLPEPRNFLQLVMHGVDAADGQGTPLMPGFGDVLTDQQMTALADYVRDRFTEEPAWQNTAGVVSALRKQSSE